MKMSWAKDRDTHVQALTLKIRQVTDRLNRLTDAYLDQTIEKDMFEERRAALIAERRAMEDQLKDLETNRRSVPDQIAKCVELAGNVNSLYQVARVEKKRRLLRILTSNCVIREKSLVFTWQMPFREIATREKSDDGRASKEMSREVSSLLGRLTQVFGEHPEVEMIGIEELV
jgi:hypothetical protein